MDSKNMGLFLQKLRKENNYTQKDISKICNVSAQAVSKWERGESFPDLEMLEKLSILYNISINELINGEKREVYNDSILKKQIIALTFSILVFLSYFFNFVSIPTDRYNEFIVMRGFYLIFSGTGGEIVILSWLVFLILISYLLLNIFQITKIIIRNKKMEVYFLLSSIFAIIVGVIWLIEGVYILIPQIIIISCIIIIVLINVDSNLVLKRLKEIVKELKVYNCAKKHYNEDIKQGVSVPRYRNRQNNSSTKIKAIVVMLFLITGFLMFIDIIDIILNNYTSSLLASRIIDACFKGLILIYSFRSIRYIDSYLFKYRVYYLNMIFISFILFLIVFVFAAFGMWIVLGIYVILSLILLILINLYAVKLDSIMLYYIE